MCGGQGSFAGLDRPANHLGIDTAKHVFVLSNEIDLVVLVDRKNGHAGFYCHHCIMPLASSRESHLIAAYADVIVLIDRLSAELLDPIVAHALRLAGSACLH